VARRFGLPPTVIERAERFLSREDQSFEELVKKLNDERAALDLARQAADHRTREADVLREKLEEELLAAKDRERRTLSREAEHLMAQVRRARDELRGVQQRLRAKKLDDAQIREAERALDRAAAEVAIGSELEALVARDVPAHADAPPHELKRGTK